MKRGIVSSDLGGLPRGTWPDTLIELRDVLSAHFMRKGVEAEKAGQEGDEVSVLLANHFGGRQFYLPTGVRIKAAILRRDICRLFNGKNGGDLAKKFGVSHRYIQIVIAGQRKLQRTPASVSSSPGSSGRVRP